jgi:hypothetical protein
MFLLLKNNYLKKLAHLTLAFLFFLVSQLKAQPQNLVPNSSFETYDTCLNNTANIILAKPWFGAQCGYSVMSPFNYICGSASTDFYHLCSGIPPYFVGSTILTYQYPRTGGGMAGAGIVFIPNNEGREYLEVTLKEQLKQDKKYCSSFYVNTPRSGGTMVSGIGMALTHDTLLQQSTPDCLFCIIDTNASIQSPIDEVITDSVGWTCIKGIYKAQGGELMMTVGSFLPWDILKYEVVPPYTYGYAYYFFDDFSVVELPDFSLQQDKDSICIGDSVLLSTTTSALWNGLQHRWYTKGNNNVKDSLLLQTYVKPTQTTTYYFQFFDTINEVPCLVDYVDSVTVYVKPTYNLALNPTDTVICAGKSISIGVDPFENLQYQWSPTVYLSNANSSKTIASPTNTITYTLTTLADNNNKECLGINTASVHIEVKACEPTEAPIIPNALNYGSILKITNLYQQTHLKIYDALGQLIYVNNNYQNNWICTESSGVYFIEMNYSTMDGKSHKIIQKIIVLRQ